MAEFELGAGKAVVLDLFIGIVPGKVLGFRKEEFPAFMRQKPRTFVQVKVDPKHRLAGTVYDGDWYPLTNVVPPASVYATGAGLLRIRPYEWRLI